MTDTHLFAPQLVALLVMLLGLCLVLLPLRLVLRQGVPIQGAESLLMTRSFKTSLAAALGCGLLLVLSGCGTAPSQAPWCPPVPAELLTEPQEPVLLTPTSPSTRPGPTRSKTPHGAEPTESGIES